MADFTAGFDHFRPPDQDTIRSGLTEGLVVLDSNVLLSAYRFAPEARNELLDALALVGDQLWIPHQVALEFHRNRMKVIADCDAAYKDVIDALITSGNELVPALTAKIRQLGNRVALPDDDRESLIENLASAFGSLSQTVERLRDDHGVGRPGQPDPIFDRIAEILAGRVGDPFGDDERKAAEAESARRTTSKIPPGYMDRAKDDASGDFFVWKQALLETQARGAGVLVLVTSDTKEDWYLRLKGQTIMARPELARECSDVANARLVMLPTRSFLSYAQSYLKADVSDETIRQAEQEQVRRSGRDLFSRVKVLSAEFESHANEVSTLQNELSLLQQDLEQQGSLGEAVESERAKGEDRHDLSIAQLRIKDRIAETERRLEAAERARALFFSSLAAATTAASLF